MGAYRCSVWQIEVAKLVPSTAPDGQPGMRFDMPMSTGAKIATVSDSEKRKTMYLDVTFSPKTCEMVKGEPKLLVRDVLPALPVHTKQKTPSALIPFSVEFSSLLRAHHAF